MTLSRSVTLPPSPQTVQEPTRAPRPPRRDTAHASSKRPSGFQGTDSSSQFNGAVKRPHKELPGDIVGHVGAETSGSQGLSMTSPNAFATTAALLCSLGASATAAPATPQGTERVPAKPWLHTYGEPLRVFYVSPDGRGSGASESEPM